MFICYGHELVISRCPRLLTFFSCLILATKRKMGRGWKFSLLLLIVGMLCQCKYSLTQVCKHWTQEAVLSSFFYLVSHRNRGMSSLIYRWSAFYMNTMLWEGSIRRKTHSWCWLDYYTVVYCLCSKTQRRDDLIHCLKFIVKKRQCVVYGVENENHLLWSVIHGSCVLVSIASWRSFLKTIFAYCSDIIGY